MSAWLVTVSPNVCGCDEHYISLEDPELREEWNVIEEELIDESWNNYSWTLHLDDEEYETEEEEDKAYTEANEEWRMDTDVFWEEWESKEAIEEEYGELEII